jgi:hypothetical protein
MKKLFILVNTYHPEQREPLYTTVPEAFAMHRSTLDEKLTTLCHSSFMRSIQSFELDDSCMLAGALFDGELWFDQVIRLTHIRISFFDFYQCIHLLNKLGSQLRSFTVNVRYLWKYGPNSIPKIRSVRKISLFNSLMNLFI